MSIEAIEVPAVRSRIWSDEDAKQAFDLLTGGTVYVTGDDGEPVLDDNGEPTPELDDDGNVVIREPQAAKFGLYDDEGKARTQGMALDRLIEANHGRRFGVSVWKDHDGKHVGALIPRKPIQRKPKEEAEAPKPKPRGRKRS